MSLFRRRIGPDSPLASEPAPMDRVTSVLGPGTVVNGRLSGSGGVRIEGSFEGEISLDGLLVIGENGKVTSEDITASSVVIAGVVKGNITAEKVEIRSTGRVWGDVTTGAFATQEGAFLKGQVRMEEQIELDFIDETEELVLETELETLDEPAAEPQEGDGAGPTEDEPAEVVSTAELDAEPAAQTSEEADPIEEESIEGETEEPAEPKPKRRGRPRKKKTAADT